KLFVFPAGSLQVGPLISATQLLGNAERNGKGQLLAPEARELPPFDRLPVVVDLTNDTITPIAGLTPQNAFAFILPLALLRGPFVNVSGAGDCLNIRSQPTTASPAIGCFRDGVLLQ